jgi:hypothetical protein
MIIGQPAQFAIESSISKACEDLSIRAIGSFVIHLGGCHYGRDAPNSTAMACSFDEVGRRITRRGTHTAPFSAAPDAGLIADSVRNAIYAEEARESYFSLSAKDFSDLIYSNHILWAPDGDEAFDDGSYVLQFDHEVSVRLVGFKSAGFCSYDPRTLRDVWIDQDTFYGLLQQWHLAFEREWAGLTSRKT